MRRASRSPVVAVASVLLLAAAGAVLAGPPEGRLRAPQREGFRGHVTASRQVDLNAALEDILMRVEVEEGERVEAGRLLAILDDRLQQVAVEAARLSAASEADLRRTVIDLEETREQLRRIESAHDDSAATEVEVQRAGAEAARAEAAHTEALERRKLAEASLELQRRRLERYRIVAPFDGTVIRITAEPGAMLTQIDPVLVLADLDTLEAQVHLPAQLYRELTVGRTYTLAAAEPVNADLSGSLKTIDPIIDPASQTFRCVFTIDNREAHLPAGFTVFLEWPPADDVVVHVDEE